MWRDVVLSLDLSGIRWSRALRGYDVLPPADILRPLWCNFGLAYDTRGDGSCAGAFGSRGCCFPEEGGDVKQVSIKSIKLTFLVRFVFV